MIRVLEFYLTSFHVGRKTSVAKKPYNPILGERFHCSFSTNDNTNMNNPLDEVKTSGESSSDVHFVAEQVSHHPPSKYSFFILLQNTSSKQSNKYSIVCMSYIPN